MRPRLSGHLDWETWLGPAPWRPYTGIAASNSWWYAYDYSLGYITTCGIHPMDQAIWASDTHLAGPIEVEGTGVIGDFGQHHFDPIQMALRKDDEFPIESEASAPPQDDFAVGPWNWVRVKYADGTTIIFDGNEVCPLLERDVIVQGPKGRFLQRKGGVVSEPPDLVEKLKEIRFDQRDWVNFVTAVKKRHFGWGEKPNAPVAHHSCTVINMATIAIRLGRTVRFDPATQRFIDDEGANALASQPMRQPWHM